MFRPMPRRVVTIVVVGLFLTVVVATAAFAAWDANCQSGEACVWRYASFVVPKASNPNSDAHYSDQNWPNTQVNMNDDVESIRNTFGQKDVVWFFNGSYSGTSFCLNAGWESGDLNAHANQYSSHLIATGSTC
jgi:hypothetical protein